MRTKRTLLLATAVSSLVMGIGIAGAQSPKESGHNGPGSNASVATGSQQGKSSQSQRGTSSEGDRSQKTTQTERNKGAQNERSQNENRAKSGAENQGKTEQNRGAAENRSNENRGTVGSEHRGPTEQNRSATENEKRGTVGSENRGTMEQNRGTAETNEGNRGSMASLSTEQRTKIHDTIIHESNAPRITRNDINVDLRVGIRLPKDRIKIRPQPLPSSIVEIEPQWRGYLYFLVGDEIVVVQPSTYEVVAVIPA